MSLPSLLRALLDPATSPLDGPLELIETHASWVLLSREHAWKIKKPITLPFLDYGTLEKRRAACEAELRLNRRYAPELYLEVVAFTGTERAPRLGVAGDAVEYAVKMRRFDEAMRLDHLAERNELAPRHMSLLAQEITAFHAGAAVAPAQSRFGSAEQALAPALENFDELFALMPLPGDRETLAALLEWTKREGKRHRAAFDARKRDGRVRECHGDLHLANLVLWRPDAGPSQAGAGHEPGAAQRRTTVTPALGAGDGGRGVRVMPFDCIEFNEDFRWIDVASELAFTLVDLVDHRRPGLACWLLNEWLVAGGDFDALRVLRFYAVYRALVRAKVAAIRAGQEEGAHAGDDLTAARAYLALAQAFGRPPTPRLTIAHGVSGAGKSVASEHLLLADRGCTTVRLRSDVERKRLFGLKPGDASGSALDAGIYAPQAHAATYRRLEELAQLALHAGWSVIVDAAFLKRAERDAFRRLAANNDVPFAILACEAPEDELRRRVAARRDDPSEATVEVLERQLAWIEPLTDEERAFAVAPSEARAIP